MKKHWKNISLLILLFILINSLAFYYYPFSSNWESVYGANFPCNNEVSNGYILDVIDNHDFIDTINQIDYKITALFYSDKYTGFGCSDDDYKISNENYFLGKKISVYKDILLIDTTRVSINNSYIWTNKGFNFSDPWLIEHEYVTLKNAGTILGYKSIYKRTIAVKKPFLLIKGVVRDTYTFNWITLIILILIDLLIISLTIYIVKK